MAEEEKVTPVAGEATSMADYEKELEASFKKIEEGDMITGTVIAVDEEEITLDLRYYTEGIIKVSDYSREPGFMVKEEVHVGDEVTATVIGRDNRRGCILLSRVEANDVLAWDKLRQLKEDKTVLNVTVKGIVNAGVIAYVEGIRGFIPASKLSLNYVEDLNEYLNKEIRVQVFDVVEEDNRLILSARGRRETRKSIQRGSWSCDRRNCRKPAAIRCFRQPGKRSFRSGSYLPDQ